MAAHNQGSEGYSGQTPFIRNGKHMYDETCFEAKVSGYNDKP